MSDYETPDVLPDWANDTLILLWVLLFGGRWLLAPAMQLTGVLSAPQLAAMDDGVLLKIYLVLAAVTCIVVTLRAVRQIQSGKPQAVAANRCASETSENPRVPIPEATINLRDLTPQSDIPGDVAPSGGDDTGD